MPSPVKKGRRTRLTPQLQTAIVNAIAGGVPFATACRLVGVSEIVGHEWRQRGEGTHVTRPATALYADFAKAIARAMAQDEARRILQLSEAAKGGVVIYEKTMTYPDGRVVREVRHAEPAWQANAFVLERHYHEQWGRKERVDLRMTIQETARQVAEELGIPVEALLAEANRMVYRQAAND